MAVESNYPRRPAFLRNVIAVTIKENNMKDSKKMVNSIQALGCFNIKIFLL
jgi:hypothetical protein